MQRAGGGECWLLTELLGGAVVSVDSGHNHAIRRFASRPSLSMLDFIGPMSQRKAGAISAVPILLLAAVTHLLLKTCFATLLMPSECLPTMLCVV